jgi:hypothetical protein
MPADPDAPAIVTSREAGSMDSESRQGWRVFGSVRREFVDIGKKAVAVLIAPRHIHCARYAEGASLWRLKIERRREDCWLGYWTNIDPSIPRPSNP